MTEDASGGLRGKSFYLHEVKRHQSIVITDIISRLGGKVDSFLTKDVNVVVTGVKEAHIDLPVDSSSTAGVKLSGTPKPLVFGSRGKALLEKAIHRNEKSQSSVLANARSWGVKVYHLDDFLKFINHLNQKMRTAKKKRSKQTAPHVKAGVLRSPFLKVEDSSRKFRPFYAQTLSFPVMSYSGKYSPFELLIPRQSGRSKDKDPSKVNFGNKEEPTSSCQRLQVPLTASATPRGPTKKSSGYCECCHMPYKDQYEHLQSEIHRSFIQNDSNYAVVDQLTASMHASFVCNPNQEVDPTLLRSSADFSSLHLSDLTETMQDTVSENEKSLQTPLDQDCSHLPAIADMFIPALDNREHFPEPIQSPSGQENVTSHLSTMQNNCPDSPDHDNLSLHMSCTTKLQELKSGDHCVDIVPHHISSKHQSVEINPESPSSVTPSKAQSNMHTLHLCRDGKIPYNISGGEYVSETKDQCEGGNGRLVLHMPKSLRGAFSNTVCSQNQKQVLDQNFKMYSNSPKILLQEGTVESFDHYESFDQFLTDHKMLLSTKRSLKSAQDIVGKPEFGIWPYLSLPRFLQLPHFSDYPLSIVNLKKRCRSFTPSPKLAKRRRISQNEKADPSWDCSTARIRQYSSVLSTMACLPVSKLGFTTKMKNRTGGESPFRHPCCLPHQFDTHDNAASKPCDDVDKSHKLFPKDPVETQVTTYSSDLGPPQLVPFFDEDRELQGHQYQDPPELFPYFTQTPKDASHTSVCKTSNSSFLSHSGGSVCIESALIPNLTWSTASSESDWDSGLLSWLTTTVPLQTKGVHDDLGLLLQKPHIEMQDGSYTSRLCSILQPS